VHAVRLIEADYAKALTPAAVARDAGVSPVRLREGLRRWYNCTFAEMLRERRVRAAVGLLEKGRSLRDIARECGFYDQAHFSRAFQTVRGISPRRFRSQLGPVNGNR
jgi:AraC-like DNA-binding protein